MAFRPHRFGRYIIVDPIAVGGMAEIYRARLAASKEGPDRVIVIKKVIANLSQNSEFLQMFEEEIKITVGLTHPNIIQIYDYGKADEQVFMAMEYVDGKNLRQFVKRLADMKSMFSIDMSCYIISQVCHSLAYAHSYKDRMTGKPLGIVHRDISPQNVMISYDGAVKLFDFGIAKAKSASEATRAGVIKGKPSYLSPEQINGEELDGRCDIFALGIVLWELLTAKRLFVAETDMGVLRLIQSAKIEPPSTLNPAIPQALDAIALKALTRDKNKRYQNAEEFQRDLHKFLYSFNPSFNPADLSYYAQELFKTEIREDRERLTKYLAMDPIDDGKEDEPEKPKKNLSNKLADGLMSTTDFNREMMDSVTSMTGTGPVAEAESKIQLASERAIPYPKMSPQQGGNAPGKPALPGMGKGPKPPVPGGPAASNTKVNLSLNSPGPPKKIANEGMVIPPWSKQGAGSNGMPRAGTSTTSLRKELDEQKTSGNKNIAVLMAIFLVGSVVVARQYGFLNGTPLGFSEPEEANQTQPLPPKMAPGQEQQRSPATTNLDPNKGISVGQSEGIISLQINTTGYQVLVNGNPVAIRNNQFAVPLNQPVNVDVIHYRYQTAKFQTKVTGQAPVSFKVDMIPLPSGLVSITTTPEVNVKLYSGNELVLEARTPIKDRPLPVGTYKAVMENSLVNLKAETELHVEEGKMTRIEKVLQNK